MRRQGRILFLYAQSITRLRIIFLVIGDGRLLSQHGEYSPRVTVRAQAGTVLLSGRCGLVTAEYLFNRANSNNTGNSAVKNQHI
jgi:hypothetical protein